MRKKSLLVLLLALLLSVSRLAGKAICADEAKESSQDTKKVAAEATALACWEKVKIQNKDELKALQVFFKDYGKHGRYLPDVERLLIKHLKDDKNALVGRLVLDLKVDSYESSTEVDVRQIPSGQLEMQGTISLMLVGVAMQVKENLLGHGAIHRFCGQVKDLGVPSSTDGSTEYYTFIGEEDDPLTFGCVYGVGFVYLHGKGKVIKDGKETPLGYDAKAKTIGAVPDATTTAPQADPKNATSTNEIQVKGQGWKAVLCEASLVNEFSETSLQVKYIAAEGQSLLVLRFFFESPDSPDTPFDFQSTKIIDAVTGTNIQPGVIKKQHGLDGTNSSLTKTRIQVLSSYTRRAREERGFLEVTLIAGVPQGKANLAIRIPGNKTVDLRPLLGSVR